MAVARLAKGGCVQACAQQSIARRRRSEAHSGSAKGGGGTVDNLPDRPARSMAPVSTCLTSPHSGTSSWVVLVESAFCPPSGRRAPDGWRTTSPSAYRGRWRTCLPASSSSHSLSAERGQSDEGRHTSRPFLYRKSLRRAGRGKQAHRGGAGGCSVLLLLFAREGVVRTGKACAPAEVKWV